MKHIIILISLLTAPFILHAQEHSQEYKVVCKRIQGCPVINGTCPTCVLVGSGQIKKSREQVHREIDEWGKRMQDGLKYDYSYLKNDNPKKETSGWGWDGPTWKGLRVLY